MPRGAYECALATADNGRCDCPDVLLEISSRCILAKKLVLGNPSCAAAPRRPPTSHLVSRSVAAMCASSAPASVLTGANPFDTVSCREPMELRPNLVDGKPGPVARGPATSQGPRRGARLRLERRPESAIRPGQLACVTNPSRRRPISGVPGTANSRTVISPLETHCG